MLFRLPREQSTQYPLLYIVNRPNFVIPPDLEFMYVEELQVILTDLDHKYNKARHIIAQRGIHKNHAMNKIDPNSSQNTTYSSITFSKVDPGTPF